MSRIIAGSHRGQRITMPDSGRTRPTTDRVREALFSAVVSWAGTADRPAAESLAGLAFLDLYAGSGAVGLEAASRGAAPVVLVESDQRTAATAGRNLRSLGLAAEVVAQRAEQLLRQPARTAHDVVFADPPYDLAADAVDQLLVAVVQQGWVAPDGLLVVERSRRGDPVGWPPGYAGWSRRYGETVLWFAQTRGAAPGTPADQEVP